jgi:hypothetical protein
MSRTNYTNRLDGQDGYFLTQQLTQTDPTKYYHLVPGVVGRRILPAVEGLSPNLPVRKFTMTKLLGRTKIGGQRSKGQPMVQVIKTEETSNIKTFENAFGWTVDEIRAARESNVDLPQDQLMAAVTTIEQDIDGCLAVGDAASNITGLANNVNIDETDAATSAHGGNTRSWLGADKDPDEIMADITAAIEAIQDSLKQAQLPGSNMPMFDQFALYLPVKHMTKLMTTRLGTANDVTLLKFIRDNFEMIKSIRPWWRLGTADAANSNGPMAVLAPALDTGEMNPFAGGAILPLDFEQLPEQYDGRNVVVPCAGKCGGAEIRFPVAFRYLKKI